MNEEVKEMSQEEKDKKTIEDAAGATHALIEKLKGTIEEYIEKGEGFNHKTRYMIAARAISAHSIMWMSHVQKELVVSEKMLAQALVNIQTAQDN